MLRQAIYLKSIPFSAFEQSIHRVQGLIAGYSANGLERLLEIYGLHRPPLTGISGAGQAFHKQACDDCTPHMNRDSGKCKNKTLFE